MVMAYWGEIIHCGGLVMLGEVYGRNLDGYMNWEKIIQYGCFCYVREGFCDGDGWL